MRNEGSSKDRERDHASVMQIANSMQEIDPELLESMQQKMVGQDVDPYGGDYLQFKNSQYMKQKHIICRLYVIISILFFESLFLIISDVIQFFNYDDDLHCYV